MDQFEAQQLALMQRQKRFQEQQAPQQIAPGQMVSGHYVATNPLSYLAEAVRAYGAQKGEENTTKQLQDLQGQRQSAIADALRGFNQSKDYSTLLTAPDKTLQSLGVQAMAHQPQLEAAKLEREDNRAWRTQEAEAARQARAEEGAVMRQERAAEAERNRQARMEQIQAQLQGQKDMRSMVAAMRPERQAQIIDTEQGKMRVLPNGQLAPLMDMQGNAISGPKGLPAAARQQDASQALQAIEQARKVLPTATSSGFGNMMDQAAGFAGMSTQGAQGAAQLKAIEGELVSKMPKMSGPQSDKDVALYKQMAGVVGDPTVPRATREAALRSVEEIQRRYATPAMQLGQQPPSNMMRPQSGGVVDFGSLR
jgi:hypothetical protein